MERDIFSYFNCWDRWLYFGIFVSLLAISLIPGLRLRSFSKVFESSWDSISVILSDSISRGHTITHSLDRLLIGLWLLANTVLISIYSGELYEVTVSGKVIDKIETIEQLFTKQHWKDSKIIVGDLGIIDLIYNGDRSDPMIDQLSKRVEALLLNEVILDSITRKRIFEGVFHENKVIIANKLSTYYLLRKVQNEWTNFTSLYTEGRDYYVSEPRRSSMPFHLLYDRNSFDENHMKNFNLT